MNLRIDAAEKPYSGGIIAETELDKLVLGPMQQKTFFYKWGEDVDIQINDFLSRDPVYVLNLSTSAGQGGDFLLTRIMYRTVEKRSK